MIYNQMVTWTAFAILAMFFAENKVKNRFFLVSLVVFLGVKFGFRKSCLCKRNDKYEVCKDLDSIRNSCDVFYIIGFGFVN